jgi:hypothetical protein
MSKATDLIRRGDTLPMATVPLCLDGNLQAAYEKAQRDLEQAEQDAETGRARGRRLAAEDPTRAARGRIDALAAEMRDSILPVRLRALSRPAFRALRHEHPPRKTESGDVLDVDQAVGVNIETFFDALLRACVVGVEEGDTVESLPSADLDMLLDERISDGQWQTLSSAAWTLNRRDVDVPFSRPSSLPTPSS